MLKSKFLVKLSSIGTILQIILNLTMMNSTVLLMLLLLWTSAILTGACARARNYTCVCAPAPSYHVSRQCFAPSIQAMNVLKGHELRATDALRTLHVRVQASYGLLASKNGRFADVFNGDFREPSRTPFQTVLKKPAKTSPLYINSINY